MTVYELCVVVPQSRRFSKKRRSPDRNLVSLPDRRYVVDRSLGEGGFRRACQVIMGAQFGGRLYDQGTVGAVLTKERIKAFLDLFYRQPVYHKRASRMIEPLDPEQEYYLLVTECIEV